MIPVINGINLLKPSTKRDSWGLFYFMKENIIKRIQEIFFEKLQEKTGWGRNQIIKIYRESVNEALIEFLDIDNHTK